MHAVPLPVRTPDKLSRLLTCSLRPPKFRVPLFETRLDNMSNHMHNTELMDQFVELRAQGQSISKISQSLASLFPPSITGPHPLAHPSASPLGNRTGRRPGARHPTSPMRSSRVILKPLMTSWPPRAVHTPATYQHGSFSSPPASSPQAPMSAGRSPSMNPPRPATRRHPSAPDSMINFDNFLINNSISASLSDGRFGRMRTACLRRMI